MKLPPSSLCHEGVISVDACPNNAEAVQNLQLGKFVKCTDNQIMPVFLSGPICVLVKKAKQKLQTVCMSFIIARTQ